MRKDDIFDRLRIHVEDLPVSDNPVTKEDLTKIFDSAKWAPSPFNSQPWEFLIIESSLKNEIKKIISKSSPHIQKEFNRVLSFPSAISVLYDNTRMDPGKNADQLGLLSLGTCLLNFNLRAAELSVKLDFLYFSADMSEERRELEKRVNLPENIRLMNIVGMGYLVSDYSMKNCRDKLKNYFSQNIYVDEFKKNYSEKGYSSALNYDVFDLVRERKSYRKHYLPKDIDKEDEFHILKASFRSNCSRKKVPWKIILVTDEGAKEKLAKHIQESVYDAYMDEGYFLRMRNWTRFSEKEMKNQKDGVFTYVMYKYVGLAMKAGMTIVSLPVMRWVRKLIVPVIAKALFYRLVKNSPLLLGIIHDQPATHEEYEEIYISIGMALQSIFLSSWALKMGIQFLSVLFNRKETADEIQRELEIPENFTIADMIRVGYIDPKAVPPQYFMVQADVRRPCSDIVHVNSYGRKSGLTFKAGQSI